MTVSLLDSTQDTNSGTSFITGSVSPTAGSLILLFLHWSRSNAIPGTVASIEGLTTDTSSWTQAGSDNYYDTAAVRYKCATYYTFADPEVPQTGAVTVTLTANCSNFIAVMCEITNADTMNPIIQTVQSSDADTPGVSNAIQMAALASSSNIVIGQVCHAAAQDTNVGSAASYTKVGSIWGTTPDIASMVQYNTGDVDFDASWSTSSNNGLTAHEIAVATGYPAPDIIDASASVYAPVVAGSTGGNTNIVQASILNYTGTLFEPVCQNNTPPNPGQINSYARFRSGSWWEKPLPAAAPIHPSNSTYITWLQTNDTYMGYTGGAGDDGTTNATPIYRPGPNDTKYTIWCLAATNAVPARFRTVEQGGTGEGLRLPEIAKTYNEYGGPLSYKDAPMCVYDATEGYYAWCFRILWNPSTNRWEQRPSENGKYRGAADICLTSSYGFDYTSSTPSFWPSTLDTGNDGTEIGVNPRTYQDETENRTARGNNSMCRVVDYDRIKAEGGLFYPIEIFLNQPIGSGRFPMTNYESPRSGAIPEGTRMRIKTTVDVTAVLTAQGYTGARLAENIAIATGLQDYGAWVGDTSGSHARIKLESTLREGRGDLWKAQNGDLDCFPFNSTYWEVIDDNYDPPNVSTGSQNCGVGAIANAGAVYTPTVQGGSQSCSIDATITQTATASSPQILQTAWPQEVDPGLIDQTATAPAPTFTLGGVQPGLIDATASVYTPTVYKQRKRHKRPRVSGNLADGGPVTGGGATTPVRHRGRRRTG